VRRGLDDAIGPSAAFHPVLAEISVMQSLRKPRILPEQARQRPEENVKSDIRGDSCKR